MKVGDDFAGGFRTVVSVPSPQDQVEFNDISPVPWEGIPVRIIVPSNYSFSKGKEKGLSDDNGFTQTFFEIHALYRSCIEQYLTRKLRLGALDNQVEARLLPGAAAQRPSRMGFYQKYSVSQLSYIYLRNNIYVERLCTEDLAVFRRAVQNGHFEITEEIYEIVMRTYPEILMQQSDKTADYQVFYGTNPTMNITVNSALVFGIGISEMYDENDDFVNHDGYLKTRALITHELIPEFEKSATDILENSTVCFFLE